MSKKQKFLLNLFMLAVAWSEQAFSDCESWLAKIIAMQGIVEYQSSGDKNWQITEIGQYLCYGDTIRTSEHARATLLLKNETNISLDQNTVLSLRADAERSNLLTWFIQLIDGSAFFRSRRTHHLNVQTPFINAVHEGTEFIVTVTPEHTHLGVYDGIVAVENQTGKYSIEKGFVAIAAINAEPVVKPLQIQLEDAVQWALYYPPIIYPIDADVFGKQRFKSVWTAYGQGNIPLALRQLGSINENEFSVMLLKASLLLGVGRADEALSLLNSILLRQPDQPEALALLAVIDLSKNRLDQAKQLVQRAFTLKPQSPVVLMTRSYLLQAQFKLKEAVNIVQQVLTLSPDNALAWARLSELQLSLGDHAAALVSARKAQQLDPNIAHSETVLGFSYLAETQIDEAKQAFLRAIKLDVADPLPRLGLALAKIRLNDISVGKTDLETAVTLDVNNAVTRSYLGKALHELDEEEYAETEFHLAQQLDPHDPTPWFYNAIQLQALNRPVQALQAMEQAKALNDNRGIHRSRLLLDEDAAVRAVNLSRIYQDLGFNRVALQQAWSALNSDSSNHSAHRFLSDSYLGLPRYRIARASELLQAQLLQPINITPVQPQLTPENIGLLNNTGPSRLSTGEYDALFTSNGAHLYLNGAYGSNNTWTDNAIITAVYDSLSFSAGQFHYESDGFRSNDPYQRDVYNALIQYAFSPDLNVQFELITDDTRNGDLPFRLNNFHRDDFEEVNELDSVRGGLHYRIAPGHDVLLSAFYTSRRHNYDQRNIIAIPGGLVDISADIDSRDSGYQTEMQYLFHEDDWDVTAGFGYLQLDNFFSNHSSGSVSRTLPLPFPPFSTKIVVPIDHTDRISTETEYFNSYVYAQYDLPGNVTTTLGLNYDNYQDDFIDKGQLNPKMGLIWKPWNNVSVRGAALRALKRPLATNQTIEPTQVAGFNQFYDGNNGTSFWQYSFGTDIRLLQDIYLGGEMNWLKLNVPIRSNTDVNNRDHSVNLYKAYFYWMLTDWLAFSGEYHFDRYRREFSLNQPDNADMQKVSTQQIPLSLRFFHDSGVFSSLTATYVDQEVTEITGTGLRSDFERFWTVDTVLGYRLPKKMGVVSVEIRNLLNESFRYQSVFDASGPQLTQFVPEREVFLKLSLNF